MHLYINALVLHSASLLSVPLSIVFHLSLARDETRRVLPHFFVTYCASVVIRVNALTTSSFTRSAALRWRSTRLALACRLSRSCRSASASATRRTRRSWCPRRRPHWTRRSRRATRTRTRPPRATRSQTRRRRTASGTGSPSNSPTRARASDGSRSSCTPSADPSVFCPRLWCDLMWCVIDGDMRWSLHSVDCTVLLVLNILHYF